MDARPLGVRVPETLVPDTSVLVDGRITELLASGDFAGARLIIPLAALAELEAQANRGLETGFAGLDELAQLQRLGAEGKLQIAFAGDRPSLEQLTNARIGAVDAMIRDIAVAKAALFVTSDRVQAHAAAAQGIRHHYVRPIVKETDLTHLALWAYFDDNTMSVHLKADCVPMAKRGRPGEVSFVQAGKKELGHKQLRDMVRECIEYAKRDYNSFIEMEKAGCTVLQVGPMRITIAQPPFSDGLELTAVRPVRKLTLDEYNLESFLRDRLHEKGRGVFIAGPPGSGKSTFAAAVAEYLHGLNRVVKTMEQPRDLQVPKEVTQYGALDGDMRWTGEVTLLVRPDHVLYDEVRTTEDFRTFADMRLAGVGLIGVTHANRAIDAIQRLIGRVDLGMIPQVVDTVLFVDDGQIATVLELEFTVKVPEGMTQEDLARPVVMIRDVMENKEVYELYTFGEQVVVMPLEQARAGSPEDKEGGRILEKHLRKYVQGHLEVSLRGNKATVYVDADEVPILIGKGGKTVQSLERKLGVRLDIKTGRGPPRRGERPDARPRPEATHATDAPRGAAAVARVRLKRTSSNVFLFVEGAEPGQSYRVEAEGATIGEATASQEGRLRFKADSPEGQALLTAEKRGFVIDVQPA